MDYKQKIMHLLNEKYNTQNINKYTSIKNIIELSLKDIEQLKELSSYDISFVTDNDLKERLNALKIVSSIKKEILDETEIRALLEDAKNLLTLMELEYREKLNKLNSISNAINNLTTENTKILIEFIQECYENRKISESEAITLIIEFSKLTINGPEKETSNIDNSNENENTSQVIITINEQELENLEELFAEYGYSYNLIHEKERKKIADYAKEENIRHVLQLLNNYNISLEDFLAKDKQITELIVFFDKEGLNNIERFLKNNHCSLNYLLSLTTIFYSRKKRFVFKSKNGQPGGIIIDPPAGMIKPIGGYENFLYCIELIRKSKGYPPDYQFTDEDFKSRADGKGMNQFLTTSKEIIENNLIILRRYKLISGDRLPYSITSLIRSNTEYLLDRIIEAGLYEYITKNMSFLNYNSSFPFKWYKIKRALDTHHEIYYRNSVNNGLIKVLRNDNENFGGITVLKEDNNRTIIQEPMAMDIMARLPRQIPSEHRVDSYGRKLEPEEEANQTFNMFYKYQVYSPIEIYKMFNTNFETGFKIEEIFESDYNNQSNILNNVEEDEVIKTLDSLELPLGNGTSYSVKKDDLTYIFYRPQNDGWPEEKIIVSRQKVLRLCSLLKRRGLWINKNMLDIEKINLLLSVLLKDSVVSVYQLRVLRNLVNNIVAKYKENIGGMHR